MMQLDKPTLPETIMEFGAPLLGDVHGELPLDAVRMACTVVITAWNAHVMAGQAWGCPQHLSELRALACGDDAPDELRQTLDTLEARFGEQFKSDTRVVGSWEVVQDPAQGFKLRCEARWPKTAA